LKGNDFEFLPFGAGRRICPGLNFGLATVEIMLANLLYCFEWELPNGMEPEDVDTTEVFGLTIHPKETLMLFPKPRHGRLSTAGGQSMDGPS
jgi:cytochrome P450